MFEVSLSRSRAQSRSLADSDLPAAEKTTEKGYLCLSYPTLHVPTARNPVSSNDKEAAMGHKQ